LRLFKSKSNKHEAVQFYVAPTDASPAKDGIAIAVLVKNEGAFIAEWLRFHIAAGVDHFILYDDGSTDDTLVAARDAVGADKLTIIPWAQRLQDAKLDRAIHNQGLAFAHAIGNFRHQFRWMAFIDIDEFLFPTQANSLPEVLAQIDSADNVILPWHMFGRQGFAETPDLTIPNYLRKHRNPYETDVKGVLNFKCLVKPTKVTKAYVHGFEVSGGQQIWNSRGQSFKYGQHRDGVFNDAPLLQLNHYYVKSDAQFEAKTNKGSIGDSAFTATFKNTDNRREMLSRRLTEIERDTVEDRAILDFCARIGFDPAG